MPNEQHLPGSKPEPVVSPGDFAFAAIGLEHIHISGMCAGLVEAGAYLKWVYDPDPEKVERFRREFPATDAARSEAEVLDDPAVRLVAGAAIPADRCALGLRVMRAGKDYFTDKAPCTTLNQLEQARQSHAETGRKYAVYYAERLHSEAGIHAGALIARGVIGRVLHVAGMGPHRLNAQSRPAWFFDIEKYGGILCDIGIHQIEQFLYYTGANDAEVQSSRVANYAHAEYPEFEDFGDVTMRANNGATGYSRVDWFTPGGLRTWGDGRTFIVGTEGSMELRKYIDVGRDATPDHLYLVTSEGEFHLHVQGKVGTPFFGELILDCLNRTENAMRQAHAFKAAELSLKAQAAAVRIKATNA